jgi:hypothetical protein
MKNEAIEMIKMPLSVVRVAAFCLPLALVASCGGSDDNAPNGGTITSSPSGYTSTVIFNNVGGVFAGGPYSFTISLKTASGVPVTNTAIYVIAPQDPPSMVPTQIWVTDTSTGVTSGPITIVAPYPVDTDAAGTIQIQVSIPVYEGADYGETIAFASGNLRVNNVITVECSDGTQTCP